VRPPGRRGAKNVSEVSLPDRNIKKSGRPFLPVNYRGLLFDLAVFVVNVFLVRLLTHYVGRLLSLTFLSDDKQAAHRLLIIVLAASAAQLVGAVLKRRPLQARLLAQHDGGGEAFGCFMILHFALTLITSAGIVALLSSEASGATTVLVFFLSMIPTALVWRAITPYKKPPQPDWRNSRAVEIVADLCLFAYMLVNLAIWNTVTSGSNIRAAGVGDLLSRALGFVLLSPVILLFYLPPRLLFLVEDYKYKATWVSMTLAVAPVAYRVIVGSPLKTDW
jgi:NADH:ubiquinone oxidoreductase subunit 6 (subunit J)